MPHTSDPTPEPPRAPAPEAGKAVASPVPTADVPVKTAAFGHDAAPENLEPARPSSPLRRALLVGLVLIGLAGGAYFLAPAIKTALETVSTDDAYVNSHVTFVAPRVAGQVSRVLVEDNNRVKKGQLLVELDKEPNQIQVAIKKAAVVAAETDLTAAQSQVRALEALGRSQRWLLQSAMEQVASQVATLRGNVANYQSKKATLVLAEGNLARGKELAPSGGISKEELQLRQQTVEVDAAAVQQALEAVYASRVNLGLPKQPPEGKDLADVPPNLDQIYSGVRTALANLAQTMAQIGMPLTRSETTPDQLLADIRKQDPDENIDQFLQKLIPNAPAVKQAEAKLLQARRDLDQAELNLRYCEIVSEIDGVVTRRNVNPGNNVQVGQNLMAVRSLTETWIDANFKETQLGDLRIGQRVRLEVDMYGKRREYAGRITGFTMGTGSTLALLPAQNATGNFVKIVQRLPVRIELTDYDPDKAPLFVGLSVVPYVYFKEPPTGPHAGDFLQPPQPVPSGVSAAGRPEDGPTPAQVVAGKPGS